MSLTRVPPILQSVAQMRNWVVEHVPGTDSMLGYDLFLKLGNDVVAGAPLQVAALAHGMPYPLEALGDQVRRFEELGLVTLSNDADRGLMLLPTARFLALLDQYSLVFESVFIVRTELRAQQLLIQSDDAALAAFARVLYDRVYDLGWLYVHNYGSTCFLMASLVHRIATLHGHAARVASCYVEIDQHLDGNHVERYLLGAQGYAKPGQIAGHAVCVIDEKLVVDFGLGSVRKNHNRDFYWGAVADYRRAGDAFARLVLPNNRTMTWKDDWQTPDGDAELARYAPCLDGFAAQYLARFR
jgi:hypothetical protein